MPSARARGSTSPGSAASAGFFCLVYGFSNAETHAWSAGLTIAAFTASAVLLARFVLIERRARHPLLPLRIVADRSRGGAYASMAVAGAALFSVFLFMTFYMQQILRFSPVKTGLGFLPLTGAIIIIAPLVQTKILPRLGPRAVIVAGMILGIIAMIIFTRLTPGGSYASPRTARAHSRRGRSGLRLLRLVRHRHARRRAHRRRRRLGHGQHRPADRRLDRHRPAQHHLRRRRWPATSPATPAQPSLAQPTHGARDTPSASPPGA